MLSRRMILVLSIPTVFLLANAQQSSLDQVVQITRDWLQGISKGDRAVLNGIMDSRFIATTPAGDVMTKNRLVPDEEGRPVNKLSPMDLDGPIVRVYGETAVLMSRLKPTNGAGPSMNGTFVFGKQGSTWKLLALHLSAQK